MFRVIKSSVWLSPLVVGAAALSAIASVPKTATASEVVVQQAATLNQVAAYGAEGAGMAEVGQVTSVSQLSDVRPTDWAFQALQSLVERYGCIVGYPDRTYRGNRALTRYEFAAGLNACLDKIQELIAAATADFVKKEDLETVKKLQEEFAAELATLRGRVDALEVRTATLEKQQFSTTTKLAGEVIFGIGDTFGDRATLNGAGGLLGGIVRNTATTVPAGSQRQRDAEEDKTETIFTDRVRLSLRSSFTGRDLLLTRLNASNTTQFSGAFTGTNMTRNSFDGPTDPANSVVVDKLYYRFPVGKSLRIHIDAINSEVYDGLVSSLSPFESSGQGAISRFGRFNPIFRANNPGLPGSFGASFDYKFSDSLSLQGAYAADRNSNDPSGKNGLFDGGNLLLGQLVFRPTKMIDVGFTYARAYYPGGDAGLTGSTGSAFANNPFNTAATGVNRFGTTSDNFGLQLQWRLTPKITFGGWAGYTQAYSRRNDDEAKIWNWAAFLAFPDLGKKGNLGGIIVGMPPKVTDNDFRQNYVNPNAAAALNRRRVDRDTSIHVEGLYRYRINDNISITPGVIVIFNPEHNSGNNTQFVGVLRTTFTF
jgi:hypothetical protein